jgi:hypothetical protein
MLRVRRFALLAFRVSLYGMRELAPCRRVETLERVRGDFACDALGRKWADPPSKMDRSPGQ